MGASKKVMMRKKPKLSHLLKHQLKQLKWHKGEITSYR